MVSNPTLSANATSKSLNHLSVSSLRHLRGHAGRKRYPFCNARIGSASAARRAGVRSGILSPHPIYWTETALLRGI
jgi:hypothetical protein